MSCRAWHAESKFRVSVTVLKKGVWRCNRKRNRMVEQESFVICIEKLHF